MLFRSRILGPDAKRQGDRACDEQSHYNCVFHSILLIVKITELDLPLTRQNNRPAAHSCQGQIALRGLTPSNPRYCGKYRSRKKPPSVACRSSQRVQFGFETLGDKMIHTGRHFLQIPGPTNVPDRVLRAMDHPVIDHRSAEFANLGAEVLEGVRKVFQTASPVVIYPASGTGAWEAAIAPLNSNRGWLQTAITGLKRCLSFTTRLPLE